MPGLEQPWAEQAGALQSPPDTDRAADLALICPLKFVHEIPEGFFRFQRCSAKRESRVGYFPAATLQRDSPGANRAGLHLCWLETTQVTLHHLKICSSLEYKPGSAHFGNNTFTKSPALVASHLPQFPHFSPHHLSSIEGGPRGQKTPRVFGRRFACKH